MTSYYLGVDIGATKSQALIATDRGEAVGFAVGGPGNYEGVGWQGLRDTLHAVVDLAEADAGVSREQIAGAGFGVAGYDWPGERVPTRQAIDALSLDCPIGLVNDAVIGLISGAREGWGVAIVAGTSNNCRGRDCNGREGRVTGCGPAFGEFGGASELVARAVQSVAVAWTRRGPATELSRAFSRKAGANSTADLLEGLALGRYTLSADAAPLVFEVAAGGDEVAEGIVRWAGQELGSLAVGVIRQLGFEELAFDVVLGGSLFEGGPMLIQAVQETVHACAPKAALVRLVAPPVVGAVLLGAEQAGLEPAVMRENLAESTLALLHAGQMPGEQRT
jgi:N-acetylglucosamine kinase-like BadF-type ATPase